MSDAIKLNRADFAGTRTLMTLILHRDRVILPVILFFLILFFSSIAAGISDFFAEASMREALVLEISLNPAIVMLLGSINDSSIGGIVAWRTAVFGPIVISLVNIFLMIRHTRSEEQKGRLELLNSTIVGRKAHLSSALITICGANMILGLAIFFSFTNLGLPAEGTLAFSLAMALFGCFFAAITAVTVQLTESSSDARYLTVAALMAFFILRILGWDDGGVSWVSWFSPLGWVHYIQAFAGEEWWILGLFLISTVVLILLAFYFSTIRDLGAGIFPSRTGPGRASFTLGSTLGLVWRMQRGMLIFWLGGFVLMGFLLGSMAQTVANIFAENPQFMNMVSPGSNGIQPLDNYLALILVLFGQVFAIYGIMSVLKLKSQEIKEYSVLIITNAVSRTRWVVYNLLFAFTGPVLILSMFILAYSLSYGLTSANSGPDLVQLLSAAFAYLPAIWVLVGLSMALFGFLPRFSGLSWFALGLFLIINILADFMNLSQQILDLSPFSHIPKLLLGDSTGGSFYLLFAIAAMLTLLGIWGYNQRDIRA